MKVDVVGKKNVKRRSLNECGERIAMMLMMRMRENERFPRLLIYRDEMRVGIGRHGPLILTSPFACMAGFFLEVHQIEGLTANRRPVRLRGLSDFERFWSACPPRRGAKWIEHSKRSVSCKVVVADPEICLFDADPSLRQGLGKQSISKQRRMSLFNWSASQLSRIIGPDCATRRFSPHVNKGRRTDLETAEWSIGDENPRPLVYLA